MQEIFQFRVYFTCGMLTSLHQNSQICMMLLKHTEKLDFIWISLTGRSKKHTTGQERKEKAKDDV